MTVPALGSRRPGDDLRTVRATGNGKTPKDLRLRKDCAGLETVFHRDLLQGGIAWTRIPPGVLLRPRCHVRGGRKPDPNGFWSRSNGRIRKCGDRLPPVYGRNETRRDNPSHPKSENSSPNLVSSKRERPCSIVKLKSIIMERRMPPGTCKSCNLPIGDWHTEWLTTKDQGLLFRGEAGIDCPNCGASIMIPGAAVGGTAPSDKPMVRRSWQRVQFWATHAQTTPIDLSTYFQSPAGSLYKNYRFDP